MSGHHTIEGAVGAAITIIALAIIAPTLGVLLRRRRRP